MSVEMAAATKPSMLAMALFYAGAGVHVFPVKGKVPLTPNGFHAATTDREAIEKWWTKWTEAGIAAPDFDAVDVDHYKQECAPTWRRIKPLIPDGTPQTRTGGGGLQFLFKAGTLRDGRIGPGVDSRYAGRNYVVLPPSQRPSGRRYEAVVSVVQRRPKPAPKFPFESGPNGEFKQLLSQMDAGEKITQGRNKAAWWRAVEILRTLPSNTDLNPVVAVVQSWVDANCGGNLDDVDVAKQVRGAAKFVAEDPLNGRRDSGTSRPEAQRLAWQRLSEIEMKSIVFRDKPLWQASAFHLVVGRKGVGKGTAIADLAARTTRGELGEKRIVVWIGSEDSAAIDIKPRIVASGGDPERVILIKDWIQLPRDIKRLGDTLIEVGEVGLLIIDPVGNHITGKNSNSDTDIRDAIAPLNDLADEYETMVVGVRHLSEKEAKAGAIAAILGASAWVQVPRAVIAIARDKSDASLSHIQCLIGNRLPPETSGRVFRIEGVMLEGLENEITRAVWNGDSTQNVENLLSATTGHHDSGESKTAEARDLILDILEEGRAGVRRARRHGFPRDPARCEDDQESAHEAQGRRADPHVSGEGRHRRNHPLDGLPDQGAEAMKRVPMPAPDPDGRELSRARGNTPNDGNWTIHAECGRDLGSATGSRSRLSGGVCARAKRSRGVSAASRSGVDVSERLPELLDAKALRSELGVTRAAAEAIMRHLPVVQIEGLRKVYVRRSDVVAYLESRTFTESEVPS